MVSSPLAVLADTANSGSPRTCASPSFSASRMPLNRLEASSVPFRPDASLTGHVPFVDRDHQRAPFLQAHVGDFEILMLQPLGRIQQQHDDFGEIDGVARIA